jgi:peptide/nickel transport system ATP-binding protein
MTSAVTQSLPTRDDPVDAPASSTAPLKITGLTIALDGAPLVDEVSLAVAAGEILALVGESGSGKTLTARAAVGLRPSDAAVQGSITLSGREIAGASEADLRSVRGSAAAMVFQDPHAALNPVQTIGTQLRAAVGLGGVRGPAARKRAVELLRRVGIPLPEEKIRADPHQLSGGQRQRAVIALALARAPKLLIADEPTTALDPPVQAEILALLRALADDGIGILLITHNLGAVASVADRVAVMRAGRIVEEASTRVLFANPQHPYTQELLASIVRLEARDAPHDMPGLPDWPVLQLDSATVRYSRAGAPALDSLSLSLAPGEVLGVIGESGSGKSTLARLVLGMAQPTSGTALVDGVDISALRGARAREARRRIAFIPQDPNASLDPSWPVARSIGEPMRIHRMGTKDEIGIRAGELIEMVGLPASAGAKRPAQLSGGQRQRVAIARALSTRPALLVADEPTSALDASVQAEILELFDRLHRELGFACVFISHDLAVVQRVSDRVLVLHHGRVVEQGPASSVLSHPRERYTRRLVAAASNLGAAPRF